MSFRDRFFTRRTAEAIMAPSSILAAGFGAAAGVLATGGLALPIAAGAAVYAGVVALKMPRVQKSTRVDIDPRQLREPWRYYVRETLDAQRRFNEAISSSGDGPVRERLEGIAERVADGVEESWRIAVHGQELQKAMHKLGSVKELQQRIVALRQRQSSPTDARLLESLEAQLQTYQRIQETAAEAQSRLQLMDARLDETVARAVELGLQTDSAILDPRLGGLGQDVDDIVAEMEALRRGLDETAASPSL